MVTRGRLSAGLSFIFIFVLILFADCPAQAGRKPASPAIQLLSPGKNAYVNIANKKVQIWWNNYQMNKTPEKSKCKDYTRPEPVVFRWKSSGKKKCRYELSVSTSPDFRNARTFKTGNNYRKVYNLYSGTKYYWKVRCISGHKQHISWTRSFFTKRCARIIWVSGAYNTRDLGGCLTSSGKRVRQGMIYRSGDFDKIKKAGKGTIKVLGIKTQLDFRKPGQRKGGIKTLPVANFYNEPITSYMGFLKYKENQKIILEAMKIFADRDNYPIMMHCIYGRDRTGTMAFLINGLLGVSKKNIYRDFDLTSLSKLSSSYPRKKIVKLDNLYNAMMNYKDPSMSLQDNIKAYLLDIGMTQEEISNIETIMLE